MKIEIVWVITALVFTLDLIIIAVKASLTYAKLTLLMNLREGREQAVDRTVRVIEERRLKTSLRLAVMLIHFMAAGLETYLLMVLIPEISLWLLLLFLLVGMVLLSLIEFIVKSITLKKSEENAIGLSPFGGFINFS